MWFNLHLKISTSLFTIFYVSGTNFVPRPNFDLILDQTLASFPDQTSVSFPDQTSVSFPDQTLALFPDQTLDLFPDCREGPGTWLQKMTNNLVNVACSTGQWHGNEANIMSKLFSCTLVLKYPLVSFPDLLLGSWV